MSDKKKVAINVLAEGKIKELEDVAQYGPGEALDELGKILNGLVRVNPMFKIVAATVIGHAFAEFVHWLYSKEGEHFKMSDALAEAASEAEKKTTERLSRFGMDDKDKTTRGTND